jgi:8-oxo-dGTP pyrophosphatase MutT (NUDIX family)
MPREYSQRVASGTDSTTDSIRRVLLSVEDALEIDVQGRTDAAVLVPLYTSGGELHAVFTKRRDDLRRHPGEISFPGGRYDEGERDLLATALREAEEEIGLPADAVEVLGALQPTPTIATGYAVYPFVGMIEAGRSWTPSAGEVADVLELSLPDLLAGYARRRLVRRGLADPDGHLPGRRPPDLGSNRADPGRSVRSNWWVCGQWSLPRSEFERRVVALGADLSNLAEPVGVVLRRRALQGIGERPSLALVGPGVGR